MVDDSGECSNDAADGEIHTEISTDVEYDEEGQTLAVQTVKRGNQRLDWRVGFKNGSYAEAHDLYYDGELLHRSHELNDILEWPNGKLNEEHEFLPVVDMEVDGEGNIHREYGGPLDGVEKAIQIINSEDPDTILDEWWSDMKEMYDKGTL